MSLSLSLSLQGMRMRNANSRGARATAARDRVMGFGKHKGRMMGSLPSSYLKWVSKNLRAREFEEWAILAEQVLEDPVYEDRIQWEFAQSILSGNNSTRARGDDVVSELLEISERFGWDWDWDNDAHRAGWREVNFELLGTSEGGRIPRRSRANATSDNKESESESESKTHKVKVSSEGGGRRKERRDRLRLNREQSTSTSNSNTESETDIIPRGRGIMNPFPGRQTLLNRFTRTTT